MRVEYTKEVKEDVIEGYGEKWGAELAKQIAENKVLDEDKEAMDILIGEVLEEKEFDLDKALDSYDPTFPNYTPSEHAFEFFNLMRLVQGEDFEFNTPIAHYFLADILLGEITASDPFPYNKEVRDTIEVNPLRIGIMASRGLAKSTVAISFFSVYSAIKGELPNGIGKVYFYLLLAASSKGGARVNALAVRAMCEDSVFLKDYFEEMRFTETESEFVRKGNGPRKNRSFLIRYQGINTGVRGSRYGERRPDLVGFDDAILNSAAAYSPVMMENLDEILHSDSTNALKGGGKGRVMLCFTPFHYGDVNTRALLCGAFTQVVLPLSKTFDTEKPVIVMATEIHSSWEAMHPKQSIVQLIVGAKKAKKLQSFLQERMLRLTSAADRLIPDNCIQYCDMKLIEDNIEMYTVCISSDYTTTSGEKSDFSGIATWAVSSSEDYFLLNLTLKKRTMNQQYIETLGEADKWKRRGKHVEIGVEVDGNQQAHVNGLKQRMIKRGSFHTFSKAKDDPYSDREGMLSKSSGVKKHERFRIASQVLLQRKMWFPEHLRDTPDMIEFVQQIKGATHKEFARADDGPDLITMVTRMNIVIPTDVMPGGVPRERGDSEGLDYFGKMNLLADNEEEEYVGCSTIF